MAPMATNIRIAQTVGITTAAFCSGSVLGISLFNVPAMLLAPGQVLARQWQIAFDRGKLINPSLALISATAYGFLTYSLYKTLNHTKAEIYAVAAIVTMSLWPWTTIVMWPTNVKLFKKYDEMKDMGIKEEAIETGAAKGESIKELVDWWGVLNVGRSLFPMAGALLGSWATLG